VIYTKPFCGYCGRAMSLLKKKGVEFEEIVASMDPEKRAEMQELSGGRMTYPQIFVDGRHIGDSDELMALERSGELDAILGL
jgi:glutaredoxin 3